MIKNKINHSLQSKIREYFEGLEEEKNNLYYKGSKLLKNVSLNLQDEIYFEVYGKFLKEIPFFKENFSNKLIHKVCSKMQDVVFSSGENIVEKKKNFSYIFFYKEFKSPGFFILIQGKVNEYLKNGISDIFFLNCKVKNNLYLV